MSPGAILRSRLKLACLTLSVLTAILGVCLWLGDLSGARTWFTLQVCALIGFPWSTYLEVRRAYRQEPPDEYRDVLIPWRVVLGAWVLLLGGFVLVDHG